MQFRTVFTLFVLLALLAFSFNFVVSDFVCPDFDCSSVVGYNSSNNFVRELEVGEVLVVNEVESESVDLMTNESEVVSNTTLENATVEGITYESIVYNQSLKEYLRSVENLNSSEFIKIIQRYNVTKTVNHRRSDTEDKKGLNHWIIKNLYFDVNGFKAVFDKLKTPFVVDSFIALVRGGKSLRSNTEYPLDELFKVCSDVKDDFKRVKLLLKNFKENNFNLIQNNFKVKLGVNELEFTFDNLLNEFKNVVQIKSNEVTSMRMTIYECINKIDVILMTYQRNVKKFKEIVDKLI